MSTSQTTKANQATDDATTEPLATEDVQADAPEPVEAPDDGKSKAGREAANYRRKLRETEAERDSLAASVDSLQRQLVAGNMPQGSTLTADALWSTGRAASEFFSEAGELDSAALTSAVRETHSTLGVHFGPDPVREQGQRSGGGPAGPSWGDALRARK
ncbi:hypothetical protein FJV46_15010 [Arthrobacter agilis]|uniref:hypothetical protein n=1 Tax=Arthrobacter agilis TaxID=37921 RepID=UPI000B35C5C9|nr:hypothetical protein [Arthrobacter agilis]OUM45701.1 hypothetical protein B8W74_00035 [Arthrobacter agilis]PPB47827.1 hypothetical protein CI784_00030 [Arthrobacter agilis]TPV21358.1 hypothetical protein FJV46_15010 [Arthrobacter agilis]VDR32698.1 Uncharacterised protein [Arthrobacter agilis]